MTSPNFLDEIAARFGKTGARISELAADSPVRDLEKNCKAVLAGIFDKLDLVPREEFEVQRDLLAKALERLAELEARVAALEAGGCSEA